MVWCGKEEALLVVDDFTARARDLQESGPGMPADDMDYMAAKVRYGRSVGEDSIG